MISGLIIVLLGFLIIGSLLTLIHLCISARPESQDDGHGN